MPPTFDTTERPIVLVWEVSRACDLACDHCRADATPERHPDELTTAEGRDLLDAAREFGDGQVVILSGGDPLKRDDLADLVAYGSEIGLRMALTPSGTDSLTPDRIHRLADAGLRRVALSLDAGDPAVHDGYRGETGVFESTLRAARWVREAGLGLQINTTVCERTVDELPAVRALVNDLGAMRWSVFFLVPVGRGTALSPVSPARADAVMDWLGRVDEESGFAVKTTEAPQYRRVRLESRGVAADDIAPREGAVATRPSVRAGDGFAFVNHVGDVTPSGFLPEPAGNVREDHLVDCYRNSDLFERIRDRNALRGKCGACEFRGVCGGSRSRAYATTGDPLGSDPLCPYVPDGYDGPLPDRLVEDASRGSDGGEAAD